MLITVEESARGFTFHPAGGKAMLAASGLEKGVGPKRMMAQVFHPASGSKAGPKAGRDERRKYARLRCKGAAEIRYLEMDARTTGTLVDLSVAGCCIEAGDALPVAENPVVEVHLRVNRSVLCVAGVVRYVRQERRAGIEFTGMTERKAQQIKDLVMEIWRHRAGLG